jgi:hypothetical protein
MALALFDRVQETTTTTGTGSVTLGGAVPGFQSFAVVGNGNTCYYTIVDGTAWEVGVGTYSTSGPTLARTTVLSNSSGNTSPITLAAGTKSIFLTYPAEKSVNLDGSNNVSPLGTVSSGVWQGSTVGVAYGGTGVTTSSGANSVMLRDANQNVSINRLNQTSNTITASGGTTTLTAASAFSQILNGTGGQTFKLPDATTLTNTTTFEFNNNATGTLTITDYANATVGTISSGGAAAIALLSNATVGGTWDVHAYIPENVTWGTNALVLGGTVITGGTWNGGTIATGYGGTGLTTYTSGGAVYANSSSTLTSGTLPVTAGGTGNTTGNSATTSQTNFSNLTIGGSQVLYAGNYNSYAPTLTGTGATGTWGINVSGNAATATSATTATNQSGGTVNATTGAFSGKVTMSNGGVGVAAASTLNVSGDITSSRAANQGVIYLGTNGTSYLYADGSGNYILGAGSTTLSLNGNQVLTAGNYNSYAPTLTGTGATGTWAINISGNAATATNGLTTVNYNSYAPTLTGTGASGTWGIRITGFANAGTPRLYASDSPYTYDGAAPYYMYMTYDGSRWLLQVSPATPSAVRVAYADAAGSAGSVDYANLTNKAGGTGTYTTSGDYRAPIFYDSNNTGYYVDPASTSNLNATNFVGTSTWTGSAGALALNLAANDGYASMRVIYNNTASGGNSDGMYIGYSNGNSGITRIFGGGSTGGAMIKYATYTEEANSFRAPIFYDSNDTNYYVNPNSTSQIRKTNLIASGTGWDDCLNLYSSDGANRWNILVDAGDSNAYRIAYNQAEAFKINTSRNVIANVDIRAPIFYDSNNTAYYVDPAGTTYLSTTNLQDGKWYTVNNQSGQSINIYVRPNGDNTYIWRHIYGGTGTGFGTGVGGYGIYNETLGGDYSILFNPAGFVTSPYSFRAPIFYDSNNTGYYGDFASTSNLNAALFSGAISRTTSVAGWFQGTYNNVGDNSTKSNPIYTIGSSYNPADTSLSNMYGVGYSHPNFFGSSRGSGWGLYTAAAGNITGVFGAESGFNTWISGYGLATGSWRAPIFYDSDDTTYYLNPNSVSNLNNLTLGNYSQNQTYPGIIITGNPNYNYNFLNGSWTGSITAGFLANCADQWEMAIHDSGTRVVSPFAFFGGGSNYILMGRSIGWGTTYIEAAESFRAPIFYDSNNTGYYGDFAGTSRMANINYDNLYFAGDTTYGLVGRNGYLDTLNGRGSDPLELCYYDGGNVIIGTSNGSKALYAASLYTSILYDKDNTAYYVDPNGTSYLSNVQATDWFRPIGGCGVYWQSYGRGIRAADIEFSYGNIGTYGDGLNGWRGYGVYPNNSILMSNGSNHGWYNPQYGWMFIMDGVGNVTFGNNVTAYSDLRLKNNVREIDNVVARRDTLAKSAIKYERDGRTRIGYGAQTLRDNGCAEFVHEADDALKIATGLGTLSVDYGETAAILAVASKLTDDRVAALEVQVQQLLEIINELRNS